jgi:hypothetical protein
LGTGVTSLQNVTLRQASFDEPLPAKSLHAVVAVESLSYSHNLTLTLSNLAASLQPKGTLIVVDDVVAPWFVDEKRDEDLQLLVERTVKTSLMTHQEWLQGFASAGLVLQQAARDLNLEYEWSVPLDDSDKSHDRLHEFVQKLGTWFGRCEGVHTCGTVARGVQLLSDVVRRSSGKSLWQAAHFRGDLTLMMYVCTKK